MNRTSISVIVVALLTSFIGCADPVAVTPTERPFETMPVIEGGLVFDSVLHTSNMEMFPTFADMNADSKPDLILGTIGNVSLQLNESTSDALRFATATAPKAVGADHDIPWG